MFIQEGRGADTASMRARWFAAHPGSVINRVDAGTKEEINQLRKEKFEIQTELSKAKKLIGRYEEAVGVDISLCI